MILSADLASKLYGHTDVIGAEIYNYNDTVPCHVIAVTEPVRNSEYDSRNQHSVFSPLDLRGMSGQGPVGREGTHAGTDHVPHPSGGFYLQLRRQVPEGNE